MGKQDACMQYHRDQTELKETRKPIKAPPDQAPAPSDGSEAYGSDLHTSCGRLAGRPVRLTCRVRKVGCSSATRPTQFGETPEVSGNGCGCTEFWGARRSGGAQLQSVEMFTSRRDELQRLNQGEVVSESFHFK